MIGLHDAAAQGRSLEETGHRPYPLPDRPWVMGQTWVNLLFAHWKVAPELLRPHVPERLELDEHDGSAWIALTPFAVTGLRLRGTPPLPLVSQFLELNCRTYVRGADGRPGIWFFSLDASSRGAVAVARRTYELPYRHARFETAGDEVRVHTEGGGEFRAVYRGTGEPAAPVEGSLEHFLTERYCLYAGDGGLRAEIHHAPWPLQPAEAEVEHWGVAPLEVEFEGEPMCHYSARQDVVIWSPERV
ncbi:MAG: uncharacterized protein QOG85_1383 [Gaiellaceae bacterium]|nr:uncharacterized protein [Gaiellaceae bacterium]